MKKYLIGKTRFQPFFERLFYFSLRGMNYGSGSDFNNSGEKYIFELLNKNFKELLIFDIGANKGNYSRLMFETLSGDYKIIAFEPTQSCIEELKKINHPNFEICEFALSDTKGETTINYDYEGSPWASINNNNYARHHKTLSASEKINTKTLDDFCQEHKISRINFAKIDVEGHEIKVLEGAKNMISNNAIDLIQFEFGLASLHSKCRLLDFFELLKNYNIYRILPNGLRKMIYHEAYEINLTSNYLAVNKNISNRFIF